jgi:hypothetical protein
MTQSKIAIVVSPSANTWDRSTLIDQVVSAVIDAGGLALIIPSQSRPQEIRSVLETVDGVVLVCPEDCGGGFKLEDARDSYVRLFGRQVLDLCINPIRIIGDRHFLASPSEWQDMAYFQQIEPSDLAISEIEKICTEMLSFVPSAGMVSAARRLAAFSNPRLAAYIKSPVTNG